MAEGMSENHPHGLGDIPRVVVDVRLDTVGDMIHLAVHYSDGTVISQQAPIAISTGAFYSDIPSGIHN